VRPTEGEPLDTVSRAQARDRDAFEMLVEQHATEIYRLAASIVGSADASDVMQDTFVAAWQQLPRLRNASTFRPWLRRICVNRARNCLRSSGRRGVPVGLDNDGARAQVDPHGDFGGAVEARALLEPAFDRLNPDQRAILALHYSMGYSIAEAADALGVPTGTAKSRLNAALRALRAAVGAPNGTPAEATS
jgi:RNA polymerase sigma-70 factor (ECF subfamily)